MKYLQVLLAYKVSMMPYIRGQNPMKHMQALPACMISFMPYGRVQGHIRYLLLACIISLMPHARGQVPYTIAGTVTGEHGRPLPGTTLVLIPNNLRTSPNNLRTSPGNLGTNPGNRGTSPDNRGNPGNRGTRPGNLGTIAGPEGRYSFTGLQPGRYLLHASFVGFQKYSTTLDLKENTILDITLERSFQNLQEVVVTGDWSEIRNREESLNLEIVNDAYLKQNLGGSLMKSLDRLPGVDAIGIGAGQSKPVIRGLSFNRVVVVENGIKHEGQQWGSDHGLEIDQYAVDRVEVIKGPSSMLYGSDAIGGVIRLDRNAVPEVNSWGGSADLTGSTNNNLLGGSVRLYLRKDKLYAALRGTYLDYGDFRVPADSVDIYSYRAALDRNFLRNTAGKEGNLHLEAGWVKNRFSNRIFLSRMENRTGFFANAHGLEPRGVDTELHDRSSRDIQYPFHQVSHWKAINRTVWRSETHTLEAELGFQRNYRQERSQYVNHGYMPPAFPYTLPFTSDLERQFEKYTWSGNIRSTFRTGRNLKLIPGIQAEFQDNRIDGRGFIIPAYRQFRSGAFLVLKQEIGSNSLVSAGLRYDLGRIATEAYRDWFPSPDGNGTDADGTDVDGTDVNGTVADGTDVDGTDVNGAGANGAGANGAGTTQVFVRRSDQLERRFSNLTWTLGYNLNLEQFTFKANAGKSFRMPIAKELAANGVNYHHFSYETGNPDLSAETAYQLDAGLEWHSMLFAIGLNPFLGIFPNYIYLNPGYEHDRLYGNGNQVFSYTQSRVIRYGGEVHAHYQPFRTLRIGLIGEYLYARQLSGEKTGFGLPFSPPASLLLHLKYTKERIWKLTEPYATLDVRLVSAQNRIVPPEEPTPGYNVVHTGIGSTIRFREQLLTIGLQVQNLFNRKYFDHTSYYRLVNVPEPGRNFMINISVPFSGRTNKTNP